MIVYNAIMYIYEQPVNSQIEIRVTVQDTQLNFGTEIIGSSDKLKANAGYRVDCNPVTMDGKKIRFGKHAVTLFIHNAEDSRVYKYPVAATATAENGTIQCFFSAANAKPENFRGAFRVPCNYDSSIKLGGRTVDGITHDLSFSGAAYIFTSSAAEVNEGDFFSATVRDKDNKAYKMQGKVVRIVEDFNPGFTLIGVQFDEGVDMHELVTKAQLDEIRKIRRH